MNGIYPVTLQVRDKGVPDGAAWSNGLTRRIDLGGLEPSRCAWDSLALTFDLVRNNSKPTPHHIVSTTAFAPPHPLVPQREMERRLFHSCLSGNSQRLAALSLHWCCPSLTRVPRGTSNRLDPGPRARPISPQRTGAGVFTFRPRSASP
jgi:hypothetical protein